MLLHVRIVFHQFNSLRVVSAVLLRDVSAYSLHARFSLFRALQRHLQSDIFFLRSSHDLQGTSGRGNGLGKCVHICCGERKNITRSVFPRSFTRRKTLKIERKIYKEISARERRGAFLDAFLRTTKARRKRVHNDRRDELCAPACLF